MSASNMPRYPKTPRHNHRVYPGVMKEDDYGHYEAANTMLDLVDENSDLDREYIVVSDNDDMEAPYEEDPDMVDLVFPIAKNPLEYKPTHNLIVRVHGKDFFLPLCPLPSSYVIKF